MTKREIKKGKRYYLVLHKRNWMYKPAVIVPVTVVKKPKRFSDWAIVEHWIAGYAYKLTVHVDWLASYEIQYAKNLLHNIKMWEKRWSANCWRHRLTHKTAKREVVKALYELPAYKQRDIMKQFKKVYPNLLKPDNSFMVSKMKMMHWDELAWVTIASKYPLKDVAKAVQQ